MVENKTTIKEPLDRRPTTSHPWSSGEINFIQDVYNQTAVLNTGNIVPWKPNPNPFIGQTVHYYDHYHHQRAAIITAIHQDVSICDLCVLYPTRQDFIQSVKHDSDHEKETWDFIQ